MATCVGANCAAAREVCKVALPLCSLTASLYEADPVGALEGCARGIVGGSEKLAPALGKSSDDVQKQWIDCLKTASTCEAVKLCQPGVVKPCTGDGCHEDGDGGLVPIPDAGTVPARAGLPGDKPACINCAVKNCASTADTCFPDTKACKPSKVNPSDPEGDCCYRFRACMNECELAFPPEEKEAAYTDCVTSDCNVSFPQGRTEFIAFGACMSAQCANCGEEP